MPSLAETSECAELMTAVLVGDNTETVTMQKLQEITRLMDKVRQMQKEQLKQDILYLTNELGGSDSPTSRESGEASFDGLSEIEGSLKSKVDATSARSASVTRECQQQKQELAAAEKDLQAFKEQRQSQKESRISSLPKARCDFNLYSNITNMRWQFSCEPHEIKGYICNKNDVKTFNLNSQEVSRFYISNYLWDLIEEDW